MNNLIKRRAGLKQKLNDNQFVITAELCPPKGPDVSSFLKKADLLKQIVDVINITDNQRAIMRLSALAAAELLQKAGQETVLQMTCRDRNRIALQSDLLGASSLGLHNILALTGDYVSEGDHPQAKPVFDLDSTLLIKTMVELNQGRNLVGKPLSGRTDFFIGAAVNPCTTPLEPQIMSFEKKIQAGAQFFQTQAIFDIQGFAKFMDYAKKFQVKIIAGILLVKSPKMARFLSENVPGVKVPLELVDRLEQSSDPLQTGIGIARKQVKKLRSLCHGVHIMTIGSEDKVGEILG